MSVRTHERMSVRTYERMYSCMIIFMHECMCAYACHCVCPFVHVCKCANRDRNNKNLRKTQCFLPASVIVSSLLSERGQLATRIRLVPRQGGKQHPTIDSEERGELSDATQRRPS